MTSLPVFRQTFGYSTLHLQWVAVFCIPTWALRKWRGMSYNTNMGFKKKFCMSPNTKWLVLKRRE